MKKYGRIEKNRIVETLLLPADADIKQMFHISLVWIEVPAACEQGWVIHAGQPVPPDYYQVMREAEYPPMQDYLDAMAKKASDDPVVQAAGDNQLSDYYSACLAVKLKYPKPI